MEYITCPYCGEEIREDEFHSHLILKHIDIVRNDEIEMIEELRQHHFNLLLEFKKNQPDLYIEFIKELSEDNDEKIKIFCMKELLSMNEFEDGYKLFNKLIEKDNKKETWLEYIIMLNRKGRYMESIKTCRKAIKIFDDINFKKRMERIIKKAEERI